MKKSCLFFSYLLLCILCFPSFAFGLNDPGTLAIGSKAPDFNLPGIDGKNYTLESFKDAKILVIAFICNHCPTSQAYEERLIKLGSNYAEKGVKLVAINPNNPASLRYDELGWSDVGDSFEDMKVRAGKNTLIFLTYTMAKRRLHQDNMGLYLHRIFLFLTKTGYSGTMVVWMIWKTPAKHLILPMQ